jgi:hypothetical protein
MPMKARRTRPCRTSSPSTKLAVLAATAKQMPCAPMITAVLMPTTSPREETSGPPELPGLSAASVWITSSMRRPLRERSERPSAETTPVVTVDSKPSGLPMAITSWPRFSRLESPSVAAGSVTASSTRNSARSVSGSSPTSRARKSWPSAVVTAMRAAAPAAPATWLLVRMSPSGATTTPEPVPPRARSLPPPRRGRARGHGKADHGRADAVDDVDDRARIGVEECLVFWGNCKADRLRRGRPRPSRRH